MKPPGRLHDRLILSGFIHKPPTKEKKIPRSRENMPRRCSPKITFQLLINLSHGTVANTRGEQGCMYLQVHVYPLATNTQRVSTRGEGQPEGLLPSLTGLLLENCFFLRDWDLGVDV